MDKKLLEECRKMDEKLTQEELEQWTKIVGESGKCEWIEEKGRVHFDAKLALLYSPRTIRRLLQSDDPKKAFCRHVLLEAATLFKSLVTVDQVREEAGKGDDLLMTFI